MCLCVFVCVCVLTENDSKTYQTYDCHDDHHLEEKHKTEEVVEIIL